jgi:molecular chaperone GrpE
MPPNNNSRRVGLVEEIEVIVEDDDTEEKTREAQRESEEPTIDECIEQLQRLQAEFDNYRKRVGREREHLADHIRGDFCKQLLFILDDMDRALAHSDQNHAALRTGIELVYKSLTSLLEKMGLSSVPALGKAFDPYVHEAVMVETDPSVKGEIVTGELQRGYLFKENLLRPAKVKVSKGTEKEISRSDGP